MKFLREEESGTSTPGNFNDYYALAQTLFAINGGTNPLVDDAWHWWIDSELLKFLRSQMT